MSDKEMKRRDGDPRTHTLWCFFILTWKSKLNECTWHKQRDWLDSNVYQKQNLWMRLKWCGAHVHSMHFAISRPNELLIFFRTILQIFVKLCGKKCVDRVLFNYREEKRRAIPKVRDSSINANEAIKWLFSDAFHSRFNQNVTDFSLNQQSILNPNENSFLWRTQSSISALLCVTHVTHSILTPFWKMYCFLATKSWYLQQTQIQLLRMSWKHNHTGYKNRILFDANFSAYSNIYVVFVIFVSPNSWTLSELCIMSINLNYGFGDGLNSCYSPLSINTYQNVMKPTCRETNTYPIPIL